MDRPMANYGGARHFNRSVTGEGGDGVGWGESTRMEHRHTSLNACRGLTSTGYWFVTPLSEA